MTTSVIIVTYNNARTIALCLESIDASAEIVLVDNASADNTVHLVRTQFPEVKIIENTANRGFAVAVNQGTTITNSDFILLLNPDAHLLPDTLKELEAVLKAQTKAGAAAPRQWLTSDQDWSWTVVNWPPHWMMLLASLRGLRQFPLARRQLVEKWVLNTSFRYCDQSVTVPFLTGSCLMLRYEALKTINGFDEGYFLFFEDTDLAIRLRQAGWSLYHVPSAHAIHSGQASVRQESDLMQQYVLQSGQRYLSRHGDPLTRLIWHIVQKRRTQRTHRDSPSEVLSAVDLQWDPHPEVVNYWVEAGPDPLFLYGIGRLTAKEQCPIPEELTHLTGNRFFWRVSPVNRDGQIEQFGRLRTWQKTR